MADGQESDRIDRRFFVATLGIAGAGWCLPLSASQVRLNKDNKEGGQENEEDVTPTEDLMREHGLLKRVLLVYDEAIRRIDAKQDLPPETVKDGAAIIRTFIEDYHEKLEEDHLFPRFEKSGQLADLTRVLRAQHQAGRRVTEQISQLATLQTLKAPQSAAKLRDLLHQFNRMYQPHEAREDTILFPALRKVVSKHEFGALGEDFEKKEQQMFGEDGFEKMVDRVAGIEKRLGIYDLEQFTPRIQA
jgi:hemerythrin-like domain-containing protein